LRTQESFDGFLTPGSGLIDLNYNVFKYRSPPVWEQAVILCQSETIDEDGIPAFTAWRQAEQYRFYFSDAGTYDLDATSIAHYPCESVLNEVLINNLLGDVLSFWLELRGVPVLHASVPVINGRAIVLLSHSGNGKSTLGAVFAQYGNPLLTDDLLPVTIQEDNFWAQSGYPYIRLWQEEAEHFLGHHDDLKKVHPMSVKRWVPLGTGFGEFCSVPKPIRCIYLPERRYKEIAGTGIEINPVSPRDATIELIRYSFAASIVEVMGLEQRRFDFFTRMAKQVPVRRISYPSGLEKLPYVREAILEDLNSNLQ